MTQEELMQKNPQWLYRIVMMYKALGEMAKHDRERIWESHWFNKPATMEMIRAVEAKLGVELDKEYVEFLQLSNGWQNFYHSSTLFGTYEFQSEAFQTAMSYLERMQDTFLELRGTRNKLLPITLSNLTESVFVIVLDGHPKAGQVWWLQPDWEEDQLHIYRCENFVGFFEEMLNLIRDETDDLIAANQQNPQ